MTLPFHVSCSEPAVPIFRLADGRYQLTKDGAIAPFMDGPGYLLLENQLAEFLRDLDIPGTAFEPATIWHRRVDREYRTHTNMTVARYFVRGDIGELDLSGLRFYVMYDQYLFASPLLKRVLAESPFQYLEFSEGLSWFAGIE
jgi:hypothetical protein